MARAKHRRVVAPPGPEVGTRSSHLLLDPRRDHLHRGELGIGRGRLAGCALGHAVTPTAGGSEVSVELSGPLRLEALVGATYGTIIPVLLANLVRVADE